ncbi:MAG: gamma carbonic anhydrase family protein [Gemmatimonadales bacterium]
MPTIHRSAFIAPGAVVLGDVTVGEESSIWYNTVMRGDVDRIEVGSQTNIQDLSMVHVDEGVPCTIGSRVGIGHRAIIHGCTIEDDCLIGMGSIILNGARIGTGSVVAAGAVVPEGMKVPPGSLVMGVPARIVRQVDSELARRIEGTWRHYVERAREHKAGKYPGLRD